MGGRGQGVYQLGRGHVQADCPYQRAGVAAAPQQSCGIGRGFTPGIGRGYGGPDWSSQQAGFGSAPQGQEIGRSEPQAYGLGTGRGFGRGIPRHPGTPISHPAAGPHPASAVTRSQGVYVQ